MREIFQASKVWFFENGLGVTGSKSTACLFIVSTVKLNMRFQ